MADFDLMAEIRRRVSAMPVPVPPAAHLAPFCTGCDWPGRCKAYGSEGCRMKADEHLHIESTRL
jgi:hypothetical protein